jgi:hypothetical protein
MVVRQINNLQLRVYNKFPCKTYKVYSPIQFKKRICLEEYAYSEEGLKLALKFMEDTLDFTLRGQSLYFRQHGHKYGKKY